MHSKVDNNSCGKVKMEKLPKSQGLGLLKDRQQILIVSLNFNYWLKFRKFTKVSSFAVVQRFTSREVTSWSTSAEQTTKLATENIGCQGFIQAVLLMSVFELRLSF